MKLNRSELIESIRKLNKEKPLKESAEIQRVLPPADADAAEQHEDALKANKERLDPKNYEKDVKDLIEETASEESRYRHFDVVDRKDLAKKINEAKEKKLPFKINRSAKEGFRYDFSVLNEDYLKKDAGNPDINTAAFNKAAGANTECELGEDLELDKELTTYQKLTHDLLRYIIENTEDKDLENTISYIISFGTDEELIRHLCDEIIAEYNAEIEKTPEEKEEKSEEQLNEELKVFTSTLEGFIPSKRAEELWNEIKDKNKIKDLEYNLEELYPDGISDSALDDLLIHEADWVKHMVGLSDEDEEEASVDELEDEDIEPISSGEEADEEEVEPIDYEEPEEEKAEEEAPVKEESKGEKEEPEEKPEEEKESEEEKEETEVFESLDPSAEKKENAEEEKEDEQTTKLAEGFIQKQFKNNEEIAEEEVASSSKENDDDTEVVDVDDSQIEDMMGLPKSEK